MQAPYHDPRALVHTRGAPPPDPYGYGQPPPGRPQMPPTIMSAPSVPMAGMPPHPGAAMHHGAPPPMAHGPASMGSPQEPSKRSRRGSIKKIIHSSDLALPIISDEEEVVTLPNNKFAYITNDATKHAELMMLNPLLEAGPKGWMNPFVDDPKPTGDLFDTPVQVPKIRLTLPFTSETTKKQEKWISFCFAISGEKGYLRLLNFDKRDDALREMLWHAMNGFNIAWTGAYLKDGKPWGGSGSKLVLVDNVEGAMKVDEGGEEIGIIA